jgi:hypothetical protein
MRQPARDTFDIYSALWARAEGEGSTVSYYAVGEPGGYFHPNERGAGHAYPMISIYRPWPEHTTAPCRGYSQYAPPDLAPPDLRHELLVLAHEFGHLMSWKGRTPRATWERYNAVAIKREKLNSEALEAAQAVPEDAQAQYVIDALWRALTDEERALILTEEALAWDVAREALAALDFAEWPEFDRERDKSLHIHRYRLGLDPLLDTDV